jgi:hypothetical protein
VTDNSPGYTVTGSQSDARGWLGRSGLDDGASADLLCHCGDARDGPEVLQRADVVVLHGQFY